MRTTLTTIITAIVAIAPTARANPASFLESDATITVDASLFSIASSLTIEHGRVWNALAPAMTGTVARPSLERNASTATDDDWSRPLTPDDFERLRFGKNVNFFLAGDEYAELGPTDESSWHLHARYPLNDWLSSAIEINGYHLIDGSRQLLPFGEAGAGPQGVPNLPSVVTLGVGAELRPHRNVAVRTAYEMPLNYTNDVLEHRWTVSFVISF